MRRLNHVAAAFAIALSLGGCGVDELLDNSDNTPECIPASRATCDCATGGPGEKTCSDDGLGYGACTCVVDGGGDEPDAGIDATVELDASIDAPPPIDAPPDT